jgi:hypothetical protein
MTFRPTLPSRGALAFIALLASCGGDDGLNSPPPVTSLRAVTITPGEADLLPGTTFTLAVQVRDDDGNLVSTPSVQWASNNTAIASVSNTGVVQATAVGTADIIASSNGKSDTAIVRVSPATVAGSWIEVFPEVVFQEMTGWEGVAQLGESECNASAFASYRDAVVDRLVNELGINRVRLEIRSGFENTQDFYGAFLQNHVIADWAAGRYQIINDNDDPRQARAGGFQFSELDHKVAQVVGPIRAALAARGERLYVNLNYVDFGASAFEHTSDPEEYAELILVTFQHLQSRYGWVPDAVEVILEPDNIANWTPEVIGRSIVATGDRLKAAGFRPAFIAPSTTNMAKSLTFLDSILSVPRVTEYLTDVAYHRYSGESTATARNIAARAQQFGLRTSMLEKIGADYHVLHEDLLEGRNSSWQQFGLAFCSTDVNGGSSYYGVNTGVTPPQIYMKSRSRYLRQYFAFVRLGAHRVGALSGDEGLDALAFRNTNGKVVTIVKADGAAPVQIRRLPAGTYGIAYTTSSQTFASLPDITVAAGGTLQFNMPAAGVVTVFRR